MKLADVIKVLIDNGVLLSDCIIRQPYTATGDRPVYLSKHTIRHNLILQSLTNLALSPVCNELAKGQREDETREEFLTRAFSVEG